MTETKSWPVQYSTSTVPDTYRCGTCGVVGCKLWREYQTFLCHQTLECCDCAGKSQEEDVSQIDADGKISVGDGVMGKYANGTEAVQRADQIGFRVPAVPTEEGDAFWGYTSDCQGETRTVIAALFVATNGPYFGLPDVDPWDVTRDARTYPGPHPVVAHPPCQLCVNFAHLNFKRYGEELRFRANWVPSWEEDKNMTKQCASYARDQTRGRLRGYLDRYGLQCAQGSAEEKERVLDDLNAFVHGLCAGCFHPGMCELGNRSRHCSCSCAVCKPDATLRAPPAK
jgi:hypothetical protein